MESILPTPILTQKEVRQILNTLVQGYPECETRWRVKLSTFKLSGVEKRAVNDVFQFLLERLDRFLSDPVTGARQFHERIASHPGKLRLSHIILIIGALEEITLELILQNPDLDIHVGFCWIHSSLLNLAFSAIQEQEFLHGSMSEESDQSGQLSKRDPIPFKEDQIRLYEAIIQYDENLLTLNGLEDILSYTVREVCRIAGFARAALFWYTPITRSLDGIYSHNIDLDDIRRIRELDYKIPGLKYVLKEKKPIYFRNVKHYLPSHHIEHFRVTSLVVAPLYGKDPFPLGFLLLDQNGQPFRPEHQMMETVHALMKRTSKALEAQLNPSRPPRFHTPSVLSNREREILQLIADGHSTKSIAAELYISEHTVAEYANTILKKLEAKNRTEAVAIALRKQWIR
ncbi:LuxR C-terminal-related transcriptional regulator [Polycladomyces subterraneus]|uniref:LuxR C-terminal-related transcriptional regulator n=1 Tax=Polycladomyces subterraneus TaxID=1016997 RepID=A0ABT8IRI5_9BACL|nr:LuxR C-terminal-related transcriptional regulator [Polycladomyces subterraneus]MDN4595419.1 LuxR C-terminal-related transcriptional regulator [Polycladomyces subterraneus]